MDDHWKNNQSIDLNYKKYRTSTPMKFTIGVTPHERSTNPH